MSHDSRLKVADPESLRLAIADRSLGARAWRALLSITRVRPPSGVLKYRSVEDANAARDAEDARMVSQVALRLLLVAWAVALVVSGTHPHDRMTWWMEVAPVLIVAPILIITARRFPLTPLAYLLMLVHGLILMVGGHYTYALVPLGDWVRDALHLARNHYDRLGHLAQGFVPAIVVREILLRASPLRRGGWLFFLTTCVALAGSAFYEMIEWWAALSTEGGAVAFLGTQGDPWDTQWDMFLCLVGALASQLLLARLHDRQLARITEVL
jgi:putative membrane protein